MKKYFRVQFNQSEFRADADQDVLSSALQNQVKMPYRCRVGGCGSCRCQLVEGRVRKLTDFSYLLSKEELAAGYILSCQSRPESDLVLLSAKRLSRFSQFENIDQGYRSVLQSESELQSQKAAGFFQYAKFFLFHLVGLYSLSCLLLGKSFLSWGLLLVLLFYIVGDVVTGDDLSTPNYKTPRVLTYQLWLALPLLAMILFAALWGVADSDVFGFGAWLSSWLPYDFVTAKAQTEWYHHLSGGVLAGLMVGLIGTITAHELTHRTSDFVSMPIGRWLLAFSFDTSFSIEHVYGHHRYVATAEDPATAPRDRNVYQHILISTMKGNISAWKIEADRLAKLGQSRFGYRNRFIRGHLMSLCLMLAAYAIGGPAALAYFVAVALWGKSLLEIVNYMEHYGLVRNHEQAVQPYHSWNTNRRISSWSMFNLTRHSHHHAQGEVPYHLLQPYPEAPMMISGYLTTILLALIPPLWFSLMRPKLELWDQKYAAQKP